MPKTDRIYAMDFAKIYPLYVLKAERKGHEAREVDEIILWLTGYSESELSELKEHSTSLQDFFDRAPRINPMANKISGMICGYRVEDITDPLLQKIRWMDKLVDELARGKSMENILRK